MAKKPQPTVFLDLDGVLTDFMGAACTLVGLEPSYLPHIYKEHDNPRDDSNEVFSNCGVWDAITEAGSDFWANLEPLPWADLLYQELTKVSKVCICTSFGNLVTHPVFSSDAAKGKVLWIEKHLQTNRVAVCARKELLAHPGAILVDDRLRNCKDFAKNGGSFWLWQDQFNMDDDYAAYVKLCCDYVKGCGR
jgi:5'(3')-deoxyribonucleotidase